MLELVRHAWWRPRLAQAQQQVQGVSEAASAAWVASWPASNNVNMLVPKHTSQHGRGARGKNCTIPRLPYLTKCGQSEKHFQSVRSWLVLHGRLELGDTSNAQPMHSCSTAQPR